MRREPAAIQWPRLAALIHDGDVTGIVEATRELTEQQRRELDR
jgi:hypothetical protein